MLSFPQPTLHPVRLEEVPKVSSAIRQALQTRRILEKLLTRVQVSGRVTLASGVQTDDELTVGCCSPFTCR